MTCRIKEAEAEIERQKIITEGFKRGQERLCDKLNTANERIKKLKEENKRMSSTLS